jgi:hypothetical protein
MAMDGAAARGHAEKARQSLDVARGTAADAVAVNVDRLERIVNVGLELDAFIDGRDLMAILDDGPPDGERLVLIAHAVLDVRLLPRLGTADVLALVREDLHMADDADFTREGRRREQQ